MNKRLVVAGLYVLVIVSVVIGLTLGPRPTGVGPRPFLPAVGVIRIEGPIMGGDLGLFGVSAGSDRVVADLRRAAEDPSIKAVVIRMNTPGGSPVASDDIGLAVRYVRDAGKPVVVSMADSATSGGYWIACFADRIVASAATMTGSIGAAIQHTNMEELLDSLGIDIDIVKSGTYKDLGSLDRPLTDDERAILQGMIDDIFDQFVDVVATGRDMTRDQVLALADGRVFTGRQALELGLVDDLGTLHDAVEMAADMAGVTVYEVRDLRQRSPLDLLSDPWGLSIPALLRSILPVPGL